MRSATIIAAAVTMFGLSAPAASQPAPWTGIVTPAEFRISSGRQQFGRRLGQSVWHATLTGSFIASTGQYYNVYGEGDFYPTFGPSSTTVSYSVTLNAIGSGAPNFGTLEGNGITPYPGSPDDAQFVVTGTTNGNGYRLSVLGNFVGGHLSGSFELLGHGGIGGGDLVGPKE